jgi:hypothetical protein
MNTHGKAVSFIFAGLLSLCAPAIAQQAADIAQQSTELVSPDQTAAATASQQTTTAQTSSGTASPGSIDETSDKKWHIYSTLYLWVPEMYGTFRSCEPTRFCRISGCG